MTIKKIVSRKTEQIYLFNHLSHRLLTWFSYSRLMTAVHLATPERGRVLPT